MQHQLRIGTGGAAVTNVVVFLCVAFAALLHELDSDLYYLSVQEDEYLEWATFWAFLGAGMLNFMAALRYWRGQCRVPWFLTGVALFCVFVALEEISWGQRIFGYRPPEYFLDRNFQQEFNLHNIVDTQFRQLALSTVILGYGVLLPGLFRVAASGRLLSRIGVVSPPIGLVPVFLATYILYVWYPWSHTGEWVEFTLGIGFLVTGTLASRPLESAPATIPLRVPLVMCITVVALGLVTAVVVRHQRQVHPGNVDAVRSELIALKRDFESGRVSIRCGTHKRLYTFVREYYQTYLEVGAFSQLTMQGMPRERAAFFLDPWNSPYWIRDRCASGGNPATAFVYSMGPNRRRDSGRTEIREDDLGEFLERRVQR